MGILTIMQDERLRSFDLWHLRLGHLSSKVMELIPNINIGGSSNLCNRTCGVCLREKQTQENLSLSNYKICFIVTCGGLIKSGLN